MGTSAENLDTRTKILPSIPAGNRRPLAVIVGFFDPPQAADVRRLREFKQPGEYLLVILTDPPEAIVPLPARAELLAALSVVDGVLPLSAKAIGGTLAGLPPARICHEPGPELARRAGFLERIQQRQRSSV